MLEKIFYDADKDNLFAKYYRLFLICVVILATSSIILDTNANLHQKYKEIIDNFEIFVFGLLLIDYLMRILRFKNQSGFFSYFTSFYGIIDFLAVMPFFIILFKFQIDDIKTFFGIITFLKIARYSPALTVLKDVIINERKPLLASLYLMLILTLAMSIILYFVERDVNPNAFSSIPHSMWWSIITLATVGYGDVYPITALGRFLGGISAILGFGMFALPAGIIANGFAEEIRRIRDVSSWNLVSKVPIFSHLESGAIEELSRLLRIKRFIKNEVIVKEGDIGDAMYFIIEGEVKVSKKEWETTLKAGDFFGEIALVKNTPRNATVTALKRCETLKLTTYDFKKSLSHYKEVLEEIENIANQREEKDKELFA